jgi:hypothetical protein
MTRYEYKMLGEWPPELDISTADEINRLGNDGWQLVTVHVWPDTELRCFYFKRERTVEMDAIDEVID